LKPQSHPIAAFLKFRASFQTTVLPSSIFEFHISFSEHLP